MVHYKLSYFPARGAGEIARQVFALAEQEFEDNRVSWDKWPEFKAQTPYGQMPVLEEDGKQLAQSLAIARYLARKFGFAGKSAWEEAQVDALADQVKDLQNEVRPFFVVLIGFAQGDVEKLKEEVFLPAVKKNLPIFVKALKKSGSGFLVGDSVTFVDLLVAQFVSDLDARENKLIDFFPDLRTHKEKIHAIPQIKKWIETRPESNF